MDATEPRVRRRGFFLHSEAGEADSGDHEAAEGLPTRVNTHRRVPRRPGGLAASGGRSRVTAATHPDNGLPQIRSGSVTGSRQRADLPR
jgi:hypothetical protein